MQENRSILRLHGGILLMYRFGDSPSYMQHLTNHLAHHYPPRCDPRSGCLCFFQPLHPTPIHGGHCFSHHYKDKSGPLPAIWFVEVFGVDRKPCSRGTCRFRQKNHGTETCSITYYSRRPIYKRVTTQRQRIRFPISLSLLCRLPLLTFQPCLLARLHFSSQPSLHQPLRHLEDYMRVASTLIEYKRKAQTLVAYSHEE